MSEPNLSGGVELDPSHLKNPTLAVLLKWWNEKRGARAMPSRADVKPAELKPCLSSILMLDVLEGGRDFRHRIVGEDIADYFAWNPTGTTVKEAFATQPEPLRKTVLQIYRCAVAQQVPVYAFGETGWAAKSVERCEALHLPLSDDGVSVNFLLSGFVFDRLEVRIARGIVGANRGELSARPE
jgi:hypothetical protein